MGRTALTVQGAMLIFALQGVWLPSASASALEALKEFVATTKSGKTTFTQRIVKNNGSLSREASGTLEFSRPGKFRWIYTKPYEQELVGDGEKLWIYDRDLNQVTVKKMGEALGASPAAILSGADDLEKNFTLKEAAARESVEWVEATPKAKETGFESVRLGFTKLEGKYALAAMELKDSFGQLSVLTFGRVERNPVFAENVFRFTPPKGADVLTQ